MPDAFKVCSCGKRYAVEEWRKLRRVGDIVDTEREYPARPGEAPIPPFELRVCSACGSSIAKDVPYEGGTDYPRGRRG